MKKVYILPLGALILLGGCNFLQKEPLTSITPNNFFTSGDDAESSLTAVYDALQASGAYGQDLLTMGEMPSDNCTSVSNDVNALETIAWTPNTGQVSNVFRQAYLGINRANIVLKYVPTITMDTLRRTQIQGEARFVRGLCYFNLVRAYGGVPLRLAPTETAQPAELNLPRVTPEQVYEQVIADLEKAAVQMPTTNANRATRSAANALLARVQLTRRNWAAAEAAANKVITSGIQLNNSFRALFPAENKGSESLFEVQFAGTPDGNNLLPDEILPFPLTTYSFSKFNLPTAELIAYADTVNDQRWSYVGNVVASGGQLIGRNHVSYIDARKNRAPSINNTNDRNSYPYKWTSSGNNFNSVDNTYVLRYAEVLLNYAEAVNEQTGPSTNVLARLNQVRQRAGLAALTMASPQAASKQAMRNEIDRQRRLELAFEGERWWDLLRYARHNQVEGGAHTVTALDLIAQFRKGERDINYLLFPIPQAEINSNPQLQQNPGY
ncbi:RagB/SusD family nutrient uptake outer membrane protein [Hymenobacter sp. GOD-10R]|uniref:RagB/SusD family nutrient uptake outer membrane protein n=1 Tax=Hymenobacter sp. GOD-10R TaxID=3093922 RepID=UPI002D78D3B2|nr:RagB/SusD family nutrient uptake outer membrane protein [Hymenobacter sp. GOD-10R]WRQ26560.1 RagB/SusD family nutrient uptake outer membrane protein [Hymenobacter sp. GOD-10R]